MTAPPTSWSHKKLPILLLVGFISVMALGVMSDAIGWDSSTILPVYLTGAWFLSVGLVLERMGLKGLGQSGQMIALFAVLILSAAWSADVLAVVSRPYADEALTRADGWFGFEWSTMIAALRDRTQVLNVLCTAYASLSWQPILLIPVLCMFRRATEAWRFLGAWSMAMALTLAIFPFFPAVGAYVHFGITKESLPGVRLEEAWQFPVLLEQLRNGSVTEMNSASLGGIIAMPSFHASGAILLGWGFYALRALRWPFLALNGAMLISAVPIGGHYLVDVLAGVFVAIFSIAAASGGVSRLGERFRSLARRKSSSCHVQRPIAPVCNGLKADTSAVRHRTHKTA